jgi:hypothetical protein
VISPQVGEFEPHPPHQFQPTGLVELEEFLRNRLTVRNANLAEGTIQTRLRAIRADEDASALDTQCLFLSRDNLFDAFLSQIKHLIHLVAGKGLLFGCSLHFHEFAAFSHNYIHIHINC